ncbi:HTH domain-containing protein [Olivibacter sp. CPCC 100613]|uniref:HTH domain-containing protein n=1 Tax=Olivibacter sp. CPCC 100613 TaxID=3079931 RepID=UPI002FF89C3C
MKLLVYIERINLLNKLIKQKRTGSPSDLSDRLGLSTSRLHKIIEELKANGAPIAYSRQYQTYFYKHEYEISFSATFKSLNNQEISLISGGTYCTADDMETKIENFSLLTGSI